MNEINENITEILEPLVGQKVLTSWILKDFVENKALPYLAEVEEEVEGIDDNQQYNGGSRSYMQIYDASSKGKVAEVILREDESVGHLFERADKRFHDLYFRDGKCFVEVKRWKERDIKQNLQRFLAKDAVSYNTSRWLVIFTYDDNYTWLDSVIDLQNTKPFITEIRIQGRTFTIHEPVLKKLREQNDAVIKFIDGEQTYIRTVEWFVENKRESFSGRHKGGWFVFANDVRSAVLFD
jgi:hypothetical protein